MALRKQNSFVQPLTIRRCTNRCTKGLRPCPTYPTVAEYRACKLLVLRVPASDLRPVTAEAACSSPVVPATLFKHFRQVGESALGSIRVSEGRTQGAWPITFLPSTPKCFAAASSCASFE